MCIERSSCCPVCALNHCLVCAAAVPDAGRQLLIPLLDAALLECASGAAAAAAAAREATRAAALGDPPWHAQAVLRPAAADARRPQSLSEDPGLPGEGEMGHHRTAGPCRT